MTESAPPDRGHAVPQALARWHWAAPLAVGLYAVVAAMTEPLTGAAALAVALPCVVVLSLVRGGHGAAATAATAATAAMDSGTRRAAMLWGTLAALVVGWELTAWLQQPAYNVPSDNHPTVSLLLDPVTDTGSLRFIAWCCWLYAGYRLVRR